MVKLGAYQLIDDFVSFMHTTHGLCKSGFHTEGCLALGYPPPPPPPRLPGSEQQQNISIVSH